ncbi:MULTISPECIES: peptidoglycan-binding protein [Streptomyces]|uniref:N-acetylmuramoyl-L-alanine amidase domain-containing protein n=1 Tax=Streptomyces luteosporeus TaxID=173856 RepID=A0ABN3TS84_9ACTN
MATPLTADQFAGALRAEGVDVVETDGWREHNRNHKGAWGPVHGVIIHHTVTSGTASSVELCYDGYEELPGPLCHGVIDKSGTVHLVGYGRANHAGTGDGAVLAAVVDETPLPGPTADDTDGNARFYGFECINLGDGEDPWPAEQLAAIERVAAALCRAHGWGAGSVIGHKEWTNTKVDPVGFEMADLRDRVAARLGASPADRNRVHRDTACEPFPGEAFFHGAPDSPVVTAMGRRLVEEGCSAYSQGPGDRWTDADRQSYARWQRKLGFAGADADGWPGRVSWDALKVPRVS